VREFIAKPEKNNGEPMVISIKNLRVSGILGVYEEERRAERDIIVNTQIEYDASDAVRTDALEDAMDYKQIRDRIVNFIEGTRFKLLEKLADGIVQELVGDERVLKVKLEVDKPHAMRLAESVSATIHWERKS
jgi:D-erythro-7,8-dihydroneopterin triphosphate epimerase